jgi:hypothetical protein
LLKQSLRSSVASNEIQVFQNKETVAKNGAQAVGN